MKGVLPSSGTDTEVSGCGHQAWHLAQAYYTTRLTIPASLFYLLILSIKQGSIKYFDSALPLQEPYYVVANLSVCPLNQFQQSSANILILGWYLHTKIDLFWIKKNLQLLYTFIYFGNMLYNEQQILIIINIFNKMNISSITHGTFDDIQTNYIKCNVNSAWNIYIHAIVYQYVHF